MLELLFRDVETVKTIEYFIVHEMWSQTVEEIALDLSISKWKMIAIVEQLGGYGLLSYIYGKQLQIQINKESKLFNPLRVLINCFNEVEILLN